MTALTPLAVSAEALLRAIVAHPEASAKVLAEASGKPAKNLARDLDILANAGLIVRHAPHILPAGLEQLELLDRTRGEVAANAVPTAGVVSLNVNLIDIEKGLNPRGNVARADIDQLAASIRAKGVVQPVLVRPGLDPNTYRLVAGERRYQATLLAGVGTIPVFIRDLSDDEAVEIALIENLERKDLDFLEEAQAFRRIIDAKVAGGVSETDAKRHVAEICGGKSIRFVEQRLALLKLSPRDQQRILLPKDHPDYLKLEHARPMTADPAKVKDRDAPFAPTPNQVLILVEMAAKLFRDGPSDRGGRWVAISQAVHQKEGRDLTKLISGGWAAAVYGGQEGSSYARMNDVAREHLISKRLDPAADPAALYRAQVAAGLKADQINGLKQANAYHTPWLNCPTPKRAKESHTLNWRGVSLKATFDPGFSGGHLEIQAANDQQLPITETGYRSHFMRGPSEIDAAGGVEAYVLAWLDREAETSKWQSHLKALKGPAPAAADSPPKPAPGPLALILGDTLSRQIRETAEGAEISRAPAIAPPRAGILMALHAGDVVSTGGAMTYRLLAVKDPKYPHILQAQAILNGRDHGKPRTLSIADIRKIESTVPEPPPAPPPRLICNHLFGISMIDTMIIRELARRVVGQAPFRPTMQAVADEAGADLADVLALLKRCKAEGDADETVESE